jgi:hypothetical protein
MSSQQISVEEPSRESHDRVINELHESAAHCQPYPFSLTSEGNFSRAFFFFFFSKRVFFRNDGNNFSFLLKTSFEETDRPVAPKGLYTRISRTHHPSKRKCSEIGLCERMMARLVPEHVRGPEPGLEEKDISQFYAPTGGIVTRI